MIQPGSRVILRTEDEIYSPCNVVSMSLKTITVSYCAGMKKVKGKEGTTPDYRTKTIARDKIVHMSERL